MTTDTGEDGAEQIDRLATFIMDNIEGEPSQSEGVVDCAIRLLGHYADESDRLREGLRRVLDDAKYTNEGYLTITESSYTAGRASLCGRTDA